MFPISKKCGINRSLSHYPWSCPTTKQLLRLTALAKNMYKTARGVKTDTEIHLGRSKAIFLKHYHIEEIGQTILMGPQYDHSTHIFCRSISSSKDQKKLRKYKVGWNIFQNRIHISYYSWFKVHIFWEG